MRNRWLVVILVTCLWQTTAHAQCAPAPDSPYFFRTLSENRAEAKIADNRAYYDQLLGDAFVSQGRDGKQLARQEYIDAELAAGRSMGESAFFSIRDYTLLEHRKGFTIASYRLIEGNTSGAATRAAETWLREIYEVLDGKWRLTAIEVAAGAPTPPEPIATR